MWTYQEIKLASRAVIITGHGPLNWTEMIGSLRERTENESGQVQLVHEDSCSALYKTLARLRRDDDLGVSLPDLAFGCGYRKAGEALDCARALFPTIGLIWKSKFTISDGMRTVYLSKGTCDKTGPLPRPSQA